MQEFHNSLWRRIIRAQTKAVSEVQQDLSNMHKLRNESIPHQHENENEC